MSKKRKSTLAERVVDKLRRMNTRVPKNLSGDELNRWCIVHDCCPHGVSYNKTAIRDGRTVHACDECRRSVDVGILSGRICAECRGTGVKSTANQQDVADAITNGWVGGVLERLSPHVCACKKGDDFLWFVEEMQKRKKVFEARP